VPLTERRGKKTGSRDPIHGVVPAVGELSGYAIYQSNTRFMPQAICGSNVTTVFLLSKRKGPLYPAGLVGIDLR